MKTEIKFTFDLENQIEVQAAIDALTKFLPAPKELAKKAIKETAPKAEVAKTEAPAAEEKATETPAPATAAPAMKRESVSALLSLKVEKSRDLIKAELARLGTKNVATMDPANFEDFHTFLSKLP